MLNDRKTGQTKVNNEIAENRAAERKQLIESLNRVANNPDGKVLFKYLMDLCGFKRFSIVANAQTSEICVQSTVYNEARRNLYLELRQLIAPETLNYIERNEDKKCEEARLQAILADL